MSAFKPQKLKAIDPDAIRGLKPDSLNALSKRQIKKANDFVDLLSNKQQDALSIDGGPSKRLTELMDDGSESLVLSSLAPLA